MKHKSRLILYIVLTVLMMALIFVQSALPADVSQTESGFLSDFLARIFHWDLEMASFIVRKFAHFLEYTVLGILLSLTVREIWNARHFAVEITEYESTADMHAKLPWLLYVLSWVIGTFYALTDEFHQNFVEGRSCELRDLAIDAGGVLLGVLIIGLVFLRKSKQTKKTV